MCTSCMLAVIYHLCVYQSCHWKIRGLMKGLRSKYARCSWPGHGDSGGQHSVGARIMIYRAITHCGSTVYNYRDCNEWSGIKELMKNLPVILALLLLTRSCTILRAMAWLTLLYFPGFSFSCVCSVKRQERFTLNIAVISHV